MGGMNNQRQRGAVSLTVGALAVLLGLVLGFSDEHAGMSNCGSLWSRADYVSSYDEHRCTVDIARRGLVTWVFLIGGAGALIYGVATLTRATPAKTH